MRQYLDLLDHILQHGAVKTDRTGTGTRSVFGYQMRFPLGETFPLLTTKKLHLRSIIHELLWFLRGETNIAYLKENKVRIWDEWADEDGELGPVYGHQWRSWPARVAVSGEAGDAGETGGSHDQIAEVVEAIRKTPDSRAPRRQRVECRRRAVHGAATLPPSLSVLRRGWSALVSTLPAQC